MQHGAPKEQVGDEVGRVRQHRALRAERRLLHSGPSQVADEARHHAGGHQAPEQPLPATSPPDGPGERVQREARRARVEDVRHQVPSE